MDALKRYREDDAKGLDYDFIEYLYLMDLCYVFKKFDLVNKIGLENKEFESIIGKANAVRNIVAHPNRSLIRNQSSIYDLHKAISVMDVLLEKLKDQIQ